MFQIGDVLRKLRKERKWSIRTLAVKSGVGRMTISDIERGTANYQKDTLELLAKAFDKSAAELEAMATAPLQVPHRRTTDSDLSPDWVAFTRRVMRLTRLAQGALQMTLLALEEAGATRGGTPDLTSEMERDEAADHPSTPKAGQSISI